MDLSNEKESGSVDPIGRENSDSASESGTSGQKSCSDCQTTKTPLWRGGPNGPKSLCNACGIRYRKKRREAMGGLKEKLGFGRVILKKQRSRSSNSHHHSSSSSSGLKKKWKQRMLGEEEQAAVLLMALSSGLLYA